MYKDICIKSVAYGDILNKELIKKQTNNNNFCNIINGSVIKFYMDALGPS